MKEDGCQIRFIFLDDIIERSRKNHELIACMMKEERTRITILFEIWYVVSLLVQIRNKSKITNLIKHHFTLTSLIMVQTERIFLSPLLHQISYLRYYVVSISG